MRSRWPLTALLLGAAGLAFAMWSWSNDPATFHFSWLAALSMWVGWPLGSLALLLIQSLTGGRWERALRAPLLAGVATLPLLLPAVVPLGFGIHALYPWARQDVANAFYLNLPFFTGRAVGYLVVWFALAGLVVRRLLQGGSVARLAPPGLLLLALTMTFAAMDATMSLDPAYNSSVYGMIAVTSAALLAMALATMQAALAGPRAALPDLSRIVLGMVVLWAYLAFVQFLIVWESDLGREARWYGARSTGIWGAVAAMLAVGNFAVPFAALLVPRLRRARGGVAAVCLWLVLMEVLRAWWLVLPAAHRAPGLVDVACMVALFGLGAGVAGLAQRREEAVV